MTQITASIVVQWTSPTAKAEWQIARSVIDAHLLQLSTQKYSQEAHESVKHKAALDHHDVKLANQGRTKRRRFAGILVVADRSLPTPEDQG